MRHLAIIAKMLYNKVEESDKITDSGEICKNLRGGFLMPQQSFAQAPNPLDSRIMKTPSAVARRAFFYLQECGHLFPREL